MRSTKVVGLWALIAALLIACMPLLILARLGELADDAEGWLFHRVIMPLRHRITDVRRDGETGGAKP